MTRCDLVGDFKQTNWMHRSLRNNSMVVILDDNVSVWRNSPNLIKMEPYKFWKPRAEEDAKLAQPLSAGAGGSSVEAAAVNEPLRYEEEPWVPGCRDHGGERFIPPSPKHT